MKAITIVHRHQLKTLGVFAFFLLTFAFLPTAGFAQRDLKDIPPTDPELERKSFIVADGFEVNLFAADPKIAKPIQMNFDPQGRLWIVSSEVYPHIKPGQKANDKVLMLEDINGDGKSDKTTVFAGGLLIPTGIAPGDGGAYVANSTELLHLKDTDGDGKADVRRTVLSGFGTEDTHHILHTLRWGPAGHLYFNQSIYIHSHIETPYGVKRLNGGGIWRFLPETLQLDVFARGWVNTWGHHFDAYGQSFVTDGAGGEGINYAVPGAAYFTAVNAPRILHGLNPGSPKLCGLEIVDGRHLPDDWQGNLIANDFRGHRVCRYVLSDDGSGFASREMSELIKTKHVAFRPIDVKMGPDGAIYIADWYNPIIQHGEVDFRDPRRDHTHGRIWRVTYKGRPLVKRPKLVKAPTPQLLKQLESPEGWTRQQAKRVLKERGAKEVLPELPKWVASLKPTDPLINRHRLEALWMYEALLHTDADLLAQLMRSDDSRVRAGATRVLARNLDVVADVVGVLSRQVADENPRVRLEAVRALSAVRDPRAVESALTVLEFPMDRFIDYALWQTCRDLQGEWLPRVQAGELTFGDDVSKLVFALRSVGNTNAIAPLVGLLKAGKVAAEKRSSVLAVVTELGGPGELQYVFDEATGENQAASKRVALLRGLTSVTRQRKIRPAGSLKAIGPLLNSENPQLQAVAAEAVGLWKIQALRFKLIGLAMSADTKPATRSAALGAIANLGGPESRKLLLRLTGKTKKPAVRMAATIALARVDLNEAATRAVDVLAELTPADKPEGLFAAFLSQKQGAAALANAVGGRKIPADIAKIGLRQASASGRKQDTLAAALRTAGGITTGARKLTDAEMQQMIVGVRERGNAVRGEAIFRREAVACLKCHAIAGAGGKVGPDLVSIGGSAQVDYLIDSLLVPNKKVKENYNTLVIVTDKGKVHTGVKVRESARELVLRDAEDKEVSIPRGSIEERADGTSLMPVGLTEKLTDAELMDLVQFMSQLGKIGQFQVSRDRVVRRWRVLQATPDAIYRIRRTRHATAATDDAAFNWKPSYSTVAGLLPTEGLPELSRNRVTPGAKGTAFVHCELEVTTAGKSQLVLNSTDGLTMWINSTPRALADAMLLDLPQGRHRLTFAIDMSTRKTGLRVQLEDVEGSAAVVRVVSGK
jgi:putative heme-binding domain-containing protein